ncbi:MAG TPA: metal ABC transporter permease [Acidimicrobiales bacterium]
MFAYHFMVNAFRAGTIVAVIAGAVGWFMVLRRQAFAGHTLSLVGFPGAAGAVWLGVSASWGYFGFCTAAALLIAALRHGMSETRSEESAGIGVVQAFALAAGFLFVSLYKGFLNGVNALLFGNFLGITDGQVVVLLVVGVAAMAALALIARPLLFASIDPDVAAARGLPVRTLSVLFLILLGLTVAEVSQITGALLVFSLLVMPAATAQALTARPIRSLAITIGLGLVITWAALTAAYYSPYPIGFWVTTFGFVGYLTSLLMRRSWAAA